jgi:hypothetical protein
LLGTIFGPLENAIGFLHIAQQSTGQMHEGKGQASGSVVDMTSVASITRWRLSALKDSQSDRNSVQRKLKDTTRALCIRLEERGEITQEKLLLFFALLKPNQLGLSRAKQRRLISFLNLDKLTGERHSGWDAALQVSEIDESKQINKAA